MKAIIIAAFCAVWAHQTHQHHHEGHFLAYKFGLNLQDDSLLHKRQVNLHNVSKTAEVILLSAGEMKEVGKIMLHFDGKISMISGHVKDLTPGKHGFHIHEKGDLTNKCVGAGGHFNPENKHHGAPTDEDRHVGDLGNIEAGPDGVAKVNMLDKLVTLDGPHSVVNRAVVVHADPDDLGKGGHEDSLTTGHAGARVACGIIKLQEHHH